jgi:hypothetical protein
MSQKSDIQRMLDEGKGYDEIEDTTGSQRSYIRSLAVEHRKRSVEEEIPGKEEKPGETPGKEETPALNFVDDVTPSKVTNGAVTGKTGLDHHKEWVKNAKYECGGCGATIGRTSDFCPHCGKTLSWEGIE